MEKRVNGFTYSELVDISVSLKAKEIEYSDLAESEMRVSASQEYKSISSRYADLWGKVSALIAEF